MTMSTTSKCLLVAFGSGWGGRATKTWHAAAFLAEVDHEPDIRQGRAHIVRCGRKSVAGTDHRHAVVAADGAGQSAQARRHPALQAPRRIVIGRVRPGRLARPAAADERGAACGSRRPGQGADQPRACGTRNPQADRESANPKDSREVLVSLTTTGLAAHDAIVAGAQERNRRLREHLSEAEFEMLLQQVDQLTAIAAEMLESEKISR